MFRPVILPNSRDGGGIVACTGPCGMNVDRMSAVELSRGRWKCRHCLHGVRTRKTAAKKAVAAA